MRVKHELVTEVKERERENMIHEQEKVIKLDTAMRKMAATTPEDELEANPKWNRLVNLHASLKKLLPEGLRCDDG